MPAGRVTRTGAKQFLQVWRAAEGHRNVSDKDSKLGDSLNRNNIASTHSWKGRGGEAAVVRLQDTVPSHDVRGTIAHTAEQHREGVLPQVEPELFAALGSPSAFRLEDFLVGVLGGKVSLDRRVTAVAVERHAGEGVAVCLIEGLDGVVETVPGCFKSGDADVLLPLSIELLAERIGDSSGLGGVDQLTRVVFRLIFW